MLAKKLVIYIKTNAGEKISNLYKLLIFSPALVLRPIIVYIYKLLIFSPALVLRPIIVNSRY